MADPHCWNISKTCLFIKKMMHYLPVSLFNLLSGHIPKSTTTSEAMQENYRVDNCTGEKRCWYFLPREQVRSQRFTMPRKKQRWPTQEIASQLNWKMILTSAVVI